MVVDQSRESNIWCGAAQGRGPRREGKESGGTRGSAEGRWARRGGPPRVRMGSDLSPRSASHRSLGVTLWELFEFGAQPYRHLSDEEVLAFVVRQQHVKLARPRLKLPYADYW